MENNSFQEKTYESMIMYGHSAVKFVILANGAAIISLLTFIGNHQKSAQNLQPAMTYFVFGVIIGGLLHVTAYLTQFVLYNQNSNRIPFYKDHVFWLWLSMFLIGIGILVFSLGALKATSALV